MEPKYLSLDEVVKQHVAQQKVGAAAGMFNNFYWDFNGGDSFITTDPPAQVVTEDIDCEIVEPKQLPASE
jgi:hypothetical protein